MNVTIEGPCFQKAAACEPILRALPAWFGIEKDILQYSAEIDGLPTLLACKGERVIGFASLKQHTPWSAEVYVMGVRPEAQGCGVGRLLICRAQEWLTSGGVEYLQVKTLGPSRIDEAYARTRAFYAAVGFKPLEEFKQIWDEHNPCLIMVKYLKEGR
jgi:GNAT superfamily N-acetyltransferase